MDMNHENNDNRKRSDKRMKLKFDTQDFPGIQVSLTPRELITHLRRMMRAENLFQAAVKMFRRSRQSKRLNTGLSRKKIHSYSRFDIAHDQVV